MVKATVNRRRSAYATMAGSTASTLVAAVQSLVLLPLYLQEIGPSVYGAWLATGEVLVWMLAFDFGIPNLLIQRAGAMLAKGDKRSIGSHFAASQIALFLIGALLLSLVWFAAPFIASLVGVTSAEIASFSVALRIAVVSTSMMLFAYGIVGLARGLQDTSLVQGVTLVGTVTGFALTAWLLLSGYGLVSIAYGLLVRSSFALLGGLAFFAFRVDREVKSSLMPTRDAIRDIAKNCPPMFAAGIGYAVMNNSMVTLAAVMFRPEAAAVLGVTRKAADLVRMVLDMIGHASYGGFAHLISEGSPDHMRKVYRELQSTFLLVATALLAAYVAVNPALIGVWVGSEMYGGFVLTLALAASTLAGSWSYFQISLFRSAGHHGSASSALLIECSARLALMVGLGFAFGMAGLAIAAVLTAIVSGVWAKRKLSAQLNITRSVRAREWGWRSLPFIGAGLIGFFGLRGGWALVLTTAAGVCVAASGLLIVIDPALTGFRRRVLGGRT